MKTAKLNTNVKLFIMTLLMLSILCVTGCIRANTTIEFKKNGKVKVSMLYAYSDEFKSYAGEDSDDLDDDLAEDKKQLEEEGWTVTDYNEDGYTGYICERESVNIDDIVDVLSEQKEDTSLNSETLTIKKDGSKYILDWDVFADADSESFSSLKMLESYGGYFNIVVKLPNKSIENNATEVSEDGKTLTWNIASMNQGDHVYVEFKLINLGAIIAVILCVLVIAGIVIAVIFVLKNKKTAVPYTQGQPQQGMGGYYQGQPGNIQSGYPQYNQSGQNFSQPNQVQSPQGYNPQGQGYTPQGQGYTPQGQGYNPQGQRYNPQGQGYNPQGQGYNPQGQGYNPQGQGYNPQGQGYNPQGQGYNPQGQGYNPHGNQGPQGR